MTQPHLAGGGAAGGSSESLESRPGRRPLSRTLLLVAWGLLLTAVFVAAQLSHDDLDAVQAFLRSLPPGS